MMKKVFCIAFFAVALALVASAGQWVRVNQLGYLPQATKVAVFMSNEDCQVSDFDLVDAFTGRVVYHGTKVERRAAMQNMKAAYRLNFSDFKQQGTFSVRVGNTLSPAFPVNGTVYNGTADFVLNYMRQQQCGYNPFQRDTCHQHDGYIRYHPTKEGQHLDVRGGWHDAADLLQYTTTSANAIYQLMFAYQENPQAFGDQYNAMGDPGANGIPDIVDQIKWGLDWLDRMNPEPGELYNQIADDRDHIGTKMPKDDPADYGWGPNNGRPVYFVNGQRQQRGKFLNATMGGASTAGKFASDFALGSKILAPFYPEFAKKIGDKAAAAYQVGIDLPGNAQTVSVVSPYIYEEDNWVDDMELGAIEMYRKTGREDYLVQAMEYGRREPVTPWMGADSARHYQWYPFMNMGHYQLALAGNPKLKAEFVRNMRAGIERVYQRAQQLNHPFLWGVPGIWCSNNLTTALLTQCILYRQLTGDRTFEEMEGSLRDWLFGCNPWGTSMIVELPRGGVYPHATHSNWVFQSVGFPTGGLVDGPVYATIFNSLKGVNLTDDMPFVATNIYEEFQPGDVVYHDSTHDYSTNEPTMDGTASLTFPLSTYQKEGAEQTAAAADRNVYDRGGIVQGDPAKKNVCLVFTADRWAEGADKIIKSLDKAGVKGAFFFTGQFFDNHPEIVKRLVKGGHYVSCHGFEHRVLCSWENRDSSLVTKEEFQADIKRAYDKMAQFGISKAAAPYFVAPYEWYNDYHASWAKQMGLQIINFTQGTFTSDDYTYPGIKGATYRSNKWLWNSLMNFEKKHSLNGHFIMLHLGTVKERTEKFYDRLPDIISMLKRKGYTIVKPDQITGLNLQ
ncbi:MAG TPA: cellulase [Porphyromonadaceae bacterium]|nr:cellulase [Porphyromonadaceae bacterium]